MAGKRAGLAGERSGLFMEQIRIVKEMRDADRKRGRTGSLVCPRFMVWEQVPGAFSSNKGKDFKAVLEETIRVADPEAPDIPLPRKGKWPLADAYYGDGWSVAYRVLDAQFWGVPQRRRRIALVADFGGHAAPEILFVREGVQGDIDESGAAGEEIAGGVGDGLDSADRIRCGNPWDPQSERVFIGDGAWHSLSSNSGGGQSRDAVFCFRLQGDMVDRDAKMNGGGVSQGPMYSLNTIDRHAVYDARGNGDGKTVCTITGDHESRVTDYTALVLPLDTTQITSKQNGSNPHYGDPCHPLAAGAHPPAIVMAHGQANAEICVDMSLSLTCNHEQPILIPRIAHTFKAKANCDFREDSETYSVTNGVVRRLTPLECERLQGYPDGWTDIGPWTDDKGKQREASDAARYKALGNSIALPPWAWLLKRLCGCYERTATMASLFDGIGGFPLIWERLNGPGSCLWASEIDQFPIAVTKAHFDGKSRW